MRSAAVSHYGSAAGTVPQLQTRQCRRPRAWRGVGVSADRGALVQCRYGKYDRADTARISRDAYLEQEQAQLEIADLSVAELKGRLGLLGENTLGLNNKSQLCKLLAVRLHNAKAQASRFPLRYVNSSSKSYFCVPLDVDDVGILDFVIDTGTTGTAITSALRDELGLSPVASHVVKGLDNQGMTLRQKIALPRLRLGPRALDISDGYVTSWSLDSAERLGGVLGLRFLSSFDVELNPSEGYIAFHPPGHVDQGVISTANCQPLSCTTTKGGLLSVTVSLNGSDPMPGILDLGAQYSTMNSAAAAAAAASGAQMNTGKVVSTDGMMNSVIRGGLSVHLGDPGQQETAYCPADITPILIRDVPVLSVLGFKDTPAMVLGKDLLCKGRTVLSLHQKTLWLERV